MIIPLLFFFLTGIPEGSEGLGLVRFELVNKVKLGYASKNYIIIVIFYLTGLPEGLEGLV